MEIGLSSSPSARPAGGDRNDYYDPLQKPAGAGGGGGGSGGGRRRKHYHQHHHHQAYHSSGVIGLLTGASPSTLRVSAAGLLAGTALAFPFLSTEAGILLVVYSAVGFGFLASLWLHGAVMSVDDGTEEMRAVSDPIRQGAQGFLRVQYTAIAQFAVPLTALILLSYQFRPDRGGAGNSGRTEALRLQYEGDLPGAHAAAAMAMAGEPTGVAVLGNLVLGAVAALGFLFGAACSAGSGYLSMWVAAQSNIRVASAARRSYPEALVVCFRGGAFSAVLNLSLCVAGVTALYTILYLVFCTSGLVSSSSTLKATDVPMLLVGYGFGASFVALFMQLGGGIYTKAADVGADLVGKVEQGIPEDDVSVVFNLPLFDHARDSSPLTAPSPFIFAARPFSFLM
jgi:inorganic pyrophosphatase